MAKQKAPPLSKQKAHTLYAVDGKRVIGVTTVTGQLNKPALVPWAWGLGMKKIDYRGYRDQKANIGTLAHYMILCHYKNLEPVMDDFSKNEIDAAENALLSFYEWEKKSELMLHWVERPLVSSLNLFGGTPDFLGETPDKKLWLIDYKTGKAIYREAFYQVVGGYTLLIEETYVRKVDGVIILNIGRSEDEQFDEKKIVNPKEIALWQKGFLDLVDFYYNDKEIKKLRRL